MLEKTGVPTAEQINSVFPGQERLEKGPVAIIECFQNIPCNPCNTACKQNAIQPFQDINDRPAIIEENCNGCGLCLTKCPGLAIMVVDLNWEETRAMIKIPYEFTPLPEKGETVHALNREGSVVTDAEVIRVQNPSSFDKTPIVSFAVPKEFVKQVRNIRRCAQS